MRCTALIVTYNRLDKLKKTIEKSIKAGFSNILIVNNGSTDGTTSWLKSLSLPKILTLHLAENIGGAGGFKVGSEYISNHMQSDWVFFYDDDAYPSSNIIEIFSNLPHDYYSVYAGLVKDIQGKHCPMNVPFLKIPTSLTDSVSYIKTPDIFLPNLTQESEVQTVSFVGMIISGPLLKENISYIHDELFIYFDDFFFGYHLTLQGVKICFNPKLEFVHDVSIQGKCISPEWKVYYLCRNLLLSRKYFPKGLLYSNSAIAVRIFKYILLLPWQKNRIAYMRFLLIGIGHGILKMSGKRH